MFAATGCFFTSAGSAQFLPSACEAMSEMYVSTCVLSLFAENGVNLVQGFDLALLYYSHNYVGFGKRVDEDINEFFKKAENQN